MPRAKGSAKEASDKLRGKLREGKAFAEQQVGGPARLQIILVLAAILGLDTADKAAVSAVAGSLKQVFQIGNTDIGILISIVSFVGAVATLPMGILVDRVNRKWVLISSIALWAAATIVSGTATSFSFLLVTRLCLGAVTAVAAPAVASLTGDFFPARERAHIYGFILAGELVGTGAGFVIAGAVSSWINWRWAFFALAIPSLALVWVVWRFLPEPARGGQSRMLPGERHIRSAEEVHRNQDEGEGTDRDGGGASGEAEQAQESMREADVQPREALVLETDPTYRSLWWAVRYVLRIPTFVLLIIASSLGYFFFSGVRAFVMIYLTQHYSLSRADISGLVIVVGLGALAGVMLGGRISEWLLRRGWLSARIVVPAGALLVGILFFAPAIWTTSAVLGTTLFTFGAASLAAANPPIDAARLDIMHPRLWGRAESTRTALRMALEGGAPALFGFVSERAFGGGERGLMWTFLIMLIPVAAASLLAFWARRTYPRDVATAGASVEALSPSD